jgi:hypothetical protein
MARRSVLVVAAALVVVGAAAGSGRPIDSGRVEVGRGIHGITLGMTRAQVVARLGKPVYQNSNGYMQYSRRHLFDVYVRGRPARVDLVSAAGPGFCLPGGICSMKKGSLELLFARYGAKVKVELTTEQGAEPDYVIRSRFRGKPTNTAMNWAKGQIGQFYIAFANTSEPVFADPPSSAQKSKVPVTSDFMTALRTAYCRDVVGQQTCSDPIFQGPLRGRQCLATEPGGQTFCDTYRLCHFKLAGLEWGQASFWLPHTGAMDTTTWFRLSRPGGQWRGYRELIVGRRLAAALRC